MVKTAEAESSERGWFDRRDQGRSRGQRQSRRRREHESGQQRCRCERASQVDSGTNVSARDQAGVGVARVDGPSSAILSPKLIPKGSEHPV